MSATHPKIWLTPLKRPETSRKPYGVFDLETDGLGGDFLLGAYALETDPVPLTFTRIESFLEIVLSEKCQGVIWYAHNGGEYDFKYLLAPIVALADERGLTAHIVLQGDRVIGFRIVVPGRKRAITLRDSFALLPSGLAKITAQFSPGHVKQDIGLSSGVRFDAANPAHVAYLHADVLGLLHSLIAFDKILYRSYGVHAQWTIPSTALRAWRRTLTRTYWRKTPLVEEFTRKAYYGGLTFLTSHAPQQDIVSLDVNSMYPWAMRSHGVPDGTATETTKYRAGLPGYYHVSVVCPNHLPFGVLAFRSTAGVVWAKGAFETWITSVELAYALQLGYKVEIIKGLVFDGIIHPHAAFVDKCETLRTLYKNQPAETAVKLMQNGLYGKHAMKPIQKRYMLSAEYPGGDLCPLIDPRTGERVEYVYYEESLVDEPYIQPHWSAWVTANARLKLYSTVARLGFQNVVYGDTDSIKVRGDAYRQAVSDGWLHIDPLEYGAWKHEGSYAVFHALAPKTYFAVDNDGMMMLRAKGVPKRAYKDEAERTGTDEQTVIRAHYQRLILGEKVTVPYESVNATMQVVTRGLPFARKASRSYSDLANSRGWRAVGSGDVEAKTADG